MIKRKYMLMVPLAIAVALLGSLMVCASPTTKRGVERIVLLESFSEGCEVDGFSFRFDFQPKGTLVNVTHIYVQFIISSNQSQHFRLRYWFNYSGQVTPKFWECDNSAWYADTYPRCQLRTIQPNDGYGGTEVCANIREGINELNVVRVYGNPMLFLHRFELFIEYEYEVQTGTAVGGFSIPIDKLSLLAPYIALASTIVLAVSISVAYVKTRKKQ